MVTIEQKQQVSCGAGRHVFSSFPCLDSTGGYTKPKKRRGEEHCPHWSAAQEENSGGS